MKKIYFMLGFMFSPVTLLAGDAVDVYDISPPAYEKLQTIIQLAISSNQDQNIFIFSIAFCFIFYQGVAVGSRY